MLDPTGFIDYLISYPTAITQTIGFFIKKGVMKDYLIQFLNTNISPIDLDTTSTVNLQSNNSVRLANLIIIERNHFGSV